MKKAKKRTERLTKPTLYAKHKATTPIPGPVPDLEPWLVNLLHKALYGKALGKDKSPTKRREGEISRAWRKAWPLQHLSLQTLDPTTHKVVLVIREQFHKHAPTSIGGHSMIVMSDEDPGRVWHG